MKRRDTFEDAETIKICQGGIDYQGIVEHVNEGIVIIKEGRIIFANDAFYEISQKNPEQVLNTDFSDFIAAKDQEKVTQYCTNRFFNEGLSDRIEFDMPRETGDAIIEMKSRVVECGGAPGLLGSLTDISERRQTRIELQRVKDRLESILHSMNEAIVSMSRKDHKILAINPASEALYGVPLRDFTMGKRHVMDFVHPDDIEKVREFYKTLPEVEFDQAEYRIISHNKKVKWVLDEGHLVYVRKGETCRLDHVIKDITEEKNAIDALRQSEEKYKDFFNSTSDMAFAMSPEGMFVDINQAGLKLLGLESKEEALVKNVGEFYVDLAERTELIKDIYGKGHVVGKRVKFKNKDGESFDVAITARVKMDDSGNVLFHEGIVHNISKALEDQRNSVLRNAAGGMCHYLNTHLMQLNMAQESMQDGITFLEQCTKAIVEGQKSQDVIPQIIKVINSMQFFQKSGNKAYERISEVTKAFNRAFIHKEEPYCTSTILDIFKSYGYQGDE